jgi:hypothetical protein
MQKLNQSRAVLSPAKLLVKDCNRSVFANYRKNLTIKDSASRGAVNVTPIAVNVSSLICVTSPI